MTPAVSEAEATFSDAISARTLVASNSSNADALSSAVSTSSDASDIEDASQAHQGTSNTETLYHVVCIVVGTGILQISQAFMQTGWLGVPCLFFSAFAVDYAGKMLVKCLYVDGKRIKGGYSDIGRIAFGAVGEYSVQFFFNFILLGTTCLYLVLAGETFSANIPGMSKQQWILVSAACLYLPYVLMRTLKEVAIMSMLGMLASMLVAVVVWVLGLMDLNNKIQNAEYHVVNLADFPKGFGTFSFSLSAVFLYPEIERSMKTPKAFPKVISLSMLIIVSIYALTGIIGYTVYGNTVQSPILPDLPQSWVTTAAAITITVHSLLACPLLITTFSLISERWMRIDAPQDNARQFILRAALRTLILCFVTSIAYALPYFDHLMSLLGSAADTLLIYFFPAMFYYKIHGIKGRNIFELGFAVLLILIGLVLGYLGTYQGLCDIINAVKKDLSVNLFFWIE